MICKDIIISALQNEYNTEYFAPNMQLERIPEYVYKRMQTQAVLTAVPQVCFLVLRWHSLYW